MRRRFVMLLPILLPLLAAVAPSARADDCADAASQADMNACADAAYKKSDAELNSLYKQITARLQGDAAARKLLIGAQKAWIGFRDAECAFQTSRSADGSIYPMLVLQCRDELTRKRADELKAYLQCQEGDLSCPVPPQ